MSLQSIVSINNLNCFDSCFALFPDCAVETLISYGRPIMWVHRVRLAWQKNASFSEISNKSITRYHIKFVSNAGVCQHLQHIHAWHIFHVNQSTLSLYLARQINQGPVAFVQLTRAPPRTSVSAKVVQSCFQTVCSGQ